MTIQSCLFLFLSIILLIVLLITNKNKTKQLKKLKETKIEEYNEQTQKQCELLKKKREEEYKKFKQEITTKEAHLHSLLQEKQTRYNELNQDLDLYRKGKIEEIDIATKEYEQRKRLENAKSIEEHNNSMKKASEELQEQLKRAEEVLRNEIEEIKHELEIERSKREAVNEEIRRQKEIEDHTDFYRIQLPEEDKNDIEILRTMAPRLRRPEAINKIIWSNYYQKPLAELRKRLLPNGDYSGIYKITRLKTKEVYIGQAVSLDRRFQDHTKSALGVGTLASSQLHRTMALDGPENFTFEVLEKVDKDKLRERESFFIDFYDSKNYGLNTIKGASNGTK